MKQKNTTQDLSKQNKRSESFDHKQLVQTTSSAFYTAGERTPVPSVLESTTPYKVMVDHEPKRALSHSSTIKPKGTLIVSAESEHLDDEDDKSAKQRR